MKKGKEKKEEEQEEEDRRIRRAFFALIRGKDPEKQDGEGQDEEEGLAVHVRMFVQLRQQEQRRIV